MNLGYVPASGARVASAPSEPHGRNGLQCGGRVVPKGMLCEIKNIATALRIYVSTLHTHTCSHIHSPTPLDQEILSS